MCLLLATNGFGEKTLILNSLYQRVLSQVLLDEMFQKPLIFVYTRRTLYRYYIPGTHYTHCNPICIHMVYALYYILPGIHRMYTLYTIHSIHILGGRQISDVHFHDLRAGSGIPSEIWLIVVIRPFKNLARSCRALVRQLSGVLLTLNPFRTAVSFWGQFGTNCLEFDWCAPKTGLEF